MSMNHVNKEPTSRLIISCAIVALVFASIALILRIEPKDTLGTKVLAIAEYVCNGERNIQARFYEGGVVVSLSGESPVTLMQVRSASGARYANEDGSIVFWSKGRTAFVEEAGVLTYAQCNAQDRTVIGEVEPQPQQPQENQKACVRAGCSGQVCTDDPNVITTCEYRQEYACYAQARCERQSDGQCGFTQDSQLQSCLMNPPKDPALQ